MILKWVFLWIPLIIILYTAIAIAVIKVIKKNSKKNDDEIKKIQLIVTNDEVEGFQDFLAFTYDLENIRKEFGKKELTNDEKEEALKSLDSKLKELQESLIYVQSEEGHPNPDILTKLFFQDLTIQTLVVRYEFEKLLGYLVESKEENVVNVFKIIPKKDE